MLEEMSREVSANRECLGVLAIERSDSPQDSTG